MIKIKKSVLMEVAEMPWRLHLPVMVPDPDVATPLRL